MSDPLTILRAAIAGDHAIELVSGPDGDIVEFSTAQGLNVRLPEGAVYIPFSSPTLFESQTPGLGTLDVKTIWFAWINKSVGITDYIAAAEEQGISHLRFLERADLVAWLDGSSSESEFIKSEPEASADGKVTTGAAGAVAAAAASGRVEKRPVSEEMRAIYERETQLATHNSILRGNKKLDFSSVSAQCHREIIHPFKNSSSKRSKPDQTSASSTPQPPLQPGKNQDPIILLSPSPSSMLNMANVKEFLENGVFDPVLRQAGSANLLRISRDSPLLGKVRFIVVDSTEKFKPEYWNRVVAVFATGQSWQFNNYKWTDPNSLFHHVLGFALTYKGDQVPAQLKEWNVKVEALDRVHRFRDRELVERIWDRLEAYMVSRGWPTKKQH